MCLIFHSDTLYLTNLSSSLTSESTSNVYLNPEQPPPSTDTRRKLSLSSANILCSCYEKRLTVQLGGVHLGSTILVGWALFI